MSKGLIVSALPPELTKRFNAALSQRPNPRAVNYITASHRTNVPAAKARAYARHYDDKGSAAMWLTGGRKAAYEKRPLATGAFLAWLTVATPRAPVDRDYAIPGDPRYYPPGPRDTSAGHVARARHASKKFSDSAREAAEWLANHFQQDAAEMGYDNFIAARVAEIMSYSFNPAYWDECSHKARTAEVAIPTSGDDTNQQPTPPGDPARRRSITTYNSVSAPYERPPIWTGLPLPSPGYDGSTVGINFQDNYHCAALDDYDLPRPYYENEFIPLIADCTATWEVQADNRPTRIQFATRTLPVLFHVDNPDHNASTPLDTSGRFYKTSRRLPPDAPPGYFGTRQRHYLLDCNIAALHFADAKGVQNQLRLKNAPAAARGKYFADSDAIHVEYDVAATVWMAKLRPDETDLNIRFQTTAGPTNAYYSAPGVFTGWGIGKFNNTHPDDWYLYQQTRFPAIVDPGGSIFWHMGAAETYDQHEDWISRDDPRFQWRHDNPNDPNETVYAIHWQEPSGRIFHAPSWIDQPGYHPPGDTIYDRFIRQYVPHFP